MKAVIPMGAMLLALAGCDRNDVRHENAARTPESKTVTAADDTKRNERDRDGTTLTPLDQGESEADRAITQQIRRDVVKSETLSINGKNVKIITQGSVVTLRGPVQSEQEKAEIGALAQSVAGVQRVDNQLEIASN